jgi:hypothetical protein
MRFFRLTLSIGLAIGSLQAVSAQDLAPRAYVITPLHANAVTLTWACNHDRHLQRTRFQLLPFLKLLRTLC